MSLLQCSRRLILAAAALAPISGAAAAAEMKAEVLHWWTSGAESAAVQELAKGFKAAGGEWVDTAIAGGGEAARPAGINRIVGGDPPTAMQFNTGKQMDDLVSQGLLRNLDGLAAEQHWKDVLPKPLYDAIVRNGHVWAVPVTDHGENWLWYSAAALARAGATPPATWDEFFAALDKLKAAGLIPLALGGQPWQENIMFDSVLLGQGGKDLYIKVYGNLDLNAVNSPEFKAIATTFGRLRDYVDPGSPNRSWNEATGLVVTAKAGFQFMGDWAKGEFSYAGQTAGKEFGCLLGPGEKNFVIGGDVFIFPKLKDAAGARAQDVLATSMFSKDTQAAFSAKKGSVPVRLDVDTSQFDVCSQQAIAVIKDPARQLVAPYVLGAPDVVQTLQDVVAEFWSDPAMTPDQFVARWVDTVNKAK